MRFMRFLAAWMVAMLAPIAAWAVTVTVPDTGIDGWIGVATSGSESGIYEFALVVGAGITVILAIMFAMVGVRVVRRVVMRAARV